MTIPLWHKSRSFDDEKSKSPKDTQTLGFWLIARNRMTYARIIDPIVPSFRNRLESTNVCSNKKKPFHSHSDALVIPKRWHFFPINHSEKSRTILPCSALSIELPPPACLQVPSSRSTSCTRLHREDSLESRVFVVVVLTLLCFFCKLFSVPRGR